MLEVMMTQIAVVVVAMMAVTYSWVGLWIGWKLFRRYVLLIIR